MYLENVGKHIDDGAFYECHNCNELVDTMIRCSEHYIQCGLIDFQGDELLCEGIAPHHLDVMNGEFILCKDKPEHFGYVFLVGPVVENKFDLFLFGSRFYIDQTTGIAEIPAYVREELIATISGE